jgi:hypothetical protein
VDYKVTPKTQLGIGAGYNNSPVEEGSSSEAVNVSGRLSWQMTEKISLRGSAGWERRKNEEVRAAIVPGKEDDAGSADGITQDSPIFNLGMLYALRENTSVTLDTYRSFRPSISEINQTFYSTGVVLSLSQRIHDRFSCTLSAGYESAEYEGAVEGVVADRTDNYWYVRPQISYTIGSRLTLSAYYQYSENDSKGSEAVSFDSSLIGTTISYSF